MSSLLNPDYTRIVAGIEYKNMSVLLADFRRHLEGEAGVPIQDLELNGALWLHDLCNFLGLGEAQRQRVLGKSAAAYLEAFLSERIDLKQ